MKVLVLNCGSSSIKYKLFEMTRKEVLAQGGIEKIGLPGSFLKMTLPDGTKKIIEKDVPEHTTGVQFIFDTLTHPEYGTVKNLHEINAVGHRVLHGGTKFSGSVLIDDAVIAAVEECCDLGPLHNPANLKGIYAVQKLLPDVPQVFREIRNPSLRFPRNIPPVCIEACMRIPEHSAGRFKNHHMPHRQRRFHRSGEGRKMRGYFHGADPIGRSDDGYTQR